MYAVRKSEVGIEMIVDVAVKLRTGPPRRAARSEHLRRVRAHKPVDYVDIVQVLLHHLVAAQPHEGVPRAMLKHHVGPFRIAFLLLDHRRPYPIAVRRQDVANGAVAHLLPRSEEHTSELQSL